MSKLMSNQDGMTLMELIIALVFISIISIAALNGLSYAFFVLSSSDAYNESTYESQSDVEGDLSILAPDGRTMTADDIKALLEDESNPLPDDEQLDFAFDWDYNVSGQYVLEDFTVEGINIENEINDASFFDESIFIFIPRLTN